MYINYYFNDYNYLSNLDYKQIECLRGYLTKKLNRNFSFNEIEEYEQLLREGKNNLVPLRYKTLKDAICCSFNETLDVDLLNTCSILSEDLVPRKELNNNLLFALMKTLSITDINRLEHDLILHNSLSTISEIHFGEKLEPKGLVKDYLYLKDKLVKKFIILSESCVE